MRYAKRSRNRRRGNRNLSTRRIFNNKGAKAQARQIYALRKSINRVKKQCAPEIKEYRTEQNTILAAPYLDSQGANRLYYKLPFPNPVNGTDDETRIGNLIKLYPCSLFLNGLYRTITHSSNGIPLYNLISSKGCGMRVVAVQNRIASNTTPSITTIFEDTFNVTTNATLTMGNLNVPFVKGITSNYYILYDKVFYFNDDKPIQNLKIKIFPKIKSLRWEQDFELPRGQIILYVIFGGLQGTAGDVNQGDYNQVEFTYWMKLPYTDA